MRCSHRRSDTAHSSASFAAVSHVSSRCCLNRWRHHCPARLLPRTIELWGWHVGVIREADQQREVWRNGVETLMLASARNGASQLAVFEQWCASGCGAPLHIHAVEEVLRVLAGRAIVRVGDDEHELATGDVVVI